MQGFVYFLIVFALSLAQDVSVYNPFDYYNFDEPLAVYESAFPWKFGFKSSSRLNMEIHYRNKPTNVIAVSVLHEIGAETFKASRNVSNNAPFSDGSEFFMIKHNLSDTEVTINVQIQYKSNMLCAPMTVARTTKLNNNTKKEYRDTDICLKMDPCVLVVDLKNFVCLEQTSQKQKINMIPAKTFTTLGYDQYTVEAETSKSPHEKVTETTKMTAIFTNPSSVTQKTENSMTATSNDIEKSHTALDSIVTLRPLENIETMTNSSADKTETTEQPSILIYVIPPVIVMSVLTVVVYIIVKKHRRRNSHPVETQELNTYATPSEVIYADLSLAHGESKPPRRDQDSPYAQIIGVMRPVDANCKNK